MSEFENVTQPRCADCGTVMRDIVGGWECVICGNIELLPAGTATIHPPIFRGPSLLGG